MDTKDLIKYQLESSANQIDKVLDGLPDNNWEGKLSDDCMSPNEVLAHLTECYIAAQVHLEDKKHNWGSYIPESDDTESLMKTMKEVRAKTHKALYESDHARAGEYATQYVILHDAYHVGQLATYRLKVDPEWDAFSIYS